MYECIFVEEICEGDMSKAALLSCQAFDVVFNEKMYCKSLIDSTPSSMVCPLTIHFTCNSMINYCHCYIRMIYAIMITIVDFYSVVNYCCSATMIMSKN